MACRYHRVRSLGSATVGWERALAIRPPARLFEITGGGGAVRELPIGRAEQRVQAMGPDDRQGFPGGVGGHHGIEGRPSDQRPRPHGRVGPAQLERMLDPRLDGLASRRIRPRRRVRSAEGELGVQLRPGLTLGGELDHVLERLAETVHPERLLTCARHGAPEVGSRLLVLLELGGLPEERRGIVHLVTVPRLLAGAP